VVDPEIGVDMRRFPSAGHLSLWAGVCPGNNESAGKGHSGRTTKGDIWLAGALVQAAWAASRTRKPYLKDKYYRIAARRGKKRAAVAIVHKILIYAYYVPMARIISGVKRVDPESIAHVKILTKQGIIADSDAKPKNKNLILEG